jgi:hypothetical protein
MRCLSCNKNLNDREATRKYETGPFAGQFVDLCNRCIIDVPIDTTENDSIPAEEYEDLGEDPVEEEDV